MSRVITFSRVFPAYHPRKGEPTNFPEQIWNSIQTMQKEYFINYYSIVNLNPGKEKEAELFWNSGKGDYSLLGSKHHTIRSGTRWKIGDRFSPRVWSGKPYASKMITIAPDIEIKQIWTFEVDENGVISVGGFYVDEKTNRRISKNDGLSIDDFRDWLIMPCFRSGKPFRGQIICWNDDIKY